MKLGAIKPVTYLKNHTSEVLDEVRDTRSPIVITRNGEAAAVVVDIKSYQATQDALVLLKMLTQSQKDIEEGRVYSQKDVERVAQRAAAGMTQEELAIFSDEAVRQRSSPTATCNAAISF